MPRNEGRPKGGTKKSSGGGIGGGVLGAMIGVPKLNMGFDPKQAVSETNQPMQKAGGFSRFFGNNADQINANALLQERANQADLERQTALEELRQKYAALNQHTGAQNDLQRIETNANVELLKAKILQQMQQQGAVTAANEMLRRVAIARALHSGALSSETPLAPESFAEIGAREYEDMPLRELGRQEAEKDTVRDVDLAAKRANTAYLGQHGRAVEAEANRPRVLGQGIFELGGNIYRDNPAQIIKDPAGFDFKSGKPTPERIRKIPGNIERVDLPNGQDDDGVNFILNGGSNRSTANKSGGSVFPDNAPNPQDIADAVTMFPTASQQVRIQATSPQVSSTTDAPEGEAPQQNPTAVNALLQRLIGNQQAKQPEPAPYQPSALELLMARKFQQPQRTY